MKIFSNCLKNVNLVLNVVLAVPCMEDLLEFAIRESLRKEA